MLEFIFGERTISNVVAYIYAHQMLFWLAEWECSYMRYNHKTKPDIFCSGTNIWIIGQT